MSNLLRGAVHFFAWLGQAQPLLETATRLVPHTAFAWSSSGWACPSHAQHLVYCFPSSSPLCTLIVSTASKPLRGYLSHLVTMMVNRVTMTENSTPCDQCQKMNRTHSPASQGNGMLASCCSLAAVVLLKRFRAVATIAVRRRATACRDLPQLAACAHSWQLAGCGESPAGGRHSAPARS